MGHRRAGILHRRPSASGPDDIEEEAKRLNITDPGARRNWAAKTRTKKNSELSPEELQEDWFGQLTDDQRDALGRAGGKESPRPAK